jgi:hypothetical protein
MWAHRSPEGLQSYGSQATDPAVELLAALGVERGAARARLADRARAEDADA